jgi:SAM-dependent methyltransferase
MAQTTGVSEQHLSADLGRDAYAGGDALGYEDHHEKSTRTRLTTWRERRLLVRGLRRAGSPAVALDLPCGTGRFWTAFAAAGVQRLIAADNSDGMLMVASRHAGAGPAVSLLRTSAFAIDLGDRAVPFVASMRFVHHLARSEDRLRVLTELRRVTSNHVLVSLWTDGNLQAWRRGRRGEKREAVAGFGRRVCTPRNVIEPEMTAAGLEVVARWPVWPGISMWTFYLLRRDDADPAA